MKTKRTVAGRMETKTNPAPKNAAVLEISKLAKASTFTIADFGKASSNAAKGYRTKEWAEAVQKASKAYGFALRWIKRKPQ